MATDLRGYSADEVLNKVLNISNDSIKVDIVAGAEYAEDAAHTTEDTGQFVLGVRNDVLAALGGTDGDYVPFQMNASGALFVDIANGGQLDTIIDTLETTLTAIETDTAALEVLSIAANVDHAANEALLITIDEDTNAIKGHVDGIETLITSTNSKIDTFDAVLDAIKGDTGTIDSDTNDIKTATESSNTHLGNMFYDTAQDVTPHDSNDLANEPFYAVWVGTGGNLRVDMCSGTGTVTLNNVASGQLLPIMVERIYATGTTASNIIVFK